MKWTKAKESSALALWSEGRTAKHIGWVFGCSRSAVLGKLRRLGAPKKRGEVAVLAMNDPNYRYSPWTPERRKAASERAKAAWATRQARQEAEYAREKQTVSYKLRQVRYSKSNEMNEIARRWNVLKAEVEEIDNALKLIDQLRPVIRKYVPNSPNA
jgi:hypothetical protein